MPNEQELNLFNLCISNYKKVMKMEITMTGK